MKNPFKRAKFELIPAREIEPGDIIAVMVPDFVSAFTRNRLTEYVGRAFPHGVKVLILDAGMTIEVYRERRKNEKADKEA